MTNEPVSHSIYNYRRNTENALSKSIDVHDVFIKKSKLRGVLLYFSRLLLLASILYSLTVKELSGLSFTWSVISGALIANFLQYKPVRKESVVIMAEFGIQLETHFWSGRVDRRFIPMGKILRPVLNECVTPVTCYWILSLILRDQEELTLVFQKSRPPVQMLVPVWKALCKASNCEDFSHSMDTLM